MAAQSGRAGNFTWAGGPMKERDTLLRRAEKMRRDSLSVRKEASQLTLEIDRQCMMEIAAGLDDGARSLEQRASCPLRTVLVASIADRAPLPARER